MEAVDHPSHYTSGAIEPIDVIEDWRLGFHLGNAVKYIARSAHKGSELEDLKKARWYLDRQIAKMQRVGPSMTKTEARAKLQAHIPHGNYGIRLKGSCPSCGNYSVEIEREGEGYRCPQCPSNHVGAVTIEQTPTSTTTTPR